MMNPLTDTELSDYRSFLKERRQRFRMEMARLCRGYGSLYAYAGLHEELGLHKVSEREGGLWRIDEYMPNAARVWLATNRIGFERLPEYELVHRGGGFWRLYLPEEALSHGDYYELHVAGKSGSGVVRRVPAFAGWVEQHKDNPDLWCARVWAPEQPYVFKHAAPTRSRFPRIYEAHIGMSQDAREHTPGSIGSYDAFIRSMLPRIKAGGYTAVQLMGVPEHPLYKSFGYQVSSYFAPSSRYGEPDGFRRLVDEAHGMGLSVILDITHAHACANTEQGIAMYDTGPYFFDERSNQWGTPSFDYSKDMTRRFLLSNCRYWMEEFHVDGFRFDAVGNMLYTDHGIGDKFEHVSHCFYAKDGKRRTNAAGELYLCLANELI
ncbi:MAG: alpha-amylase family glycosyl hydrolase, partial [Mailhella sp.]